MWKSAREIPQWDAAFADATAHSGPANVTHAGDGGEGGTFRSYSAAPDALVSAGDAMTPRVSPHVVPSEHRPAAALLGALYMIAACLAAVLPFVAFGATGLLLLVPTALWLAPGLRTNARHGGKLSDGVVGWPGLTTLGCGAASLAIMGLGEHAMAAACLASLAACGLIELTRAGLAKGDNVRAESRPNVVKRM